MSSLHPHSILTGLDTIITSVRRIKMRVRHLTLSRFPPEDLQYE